MPGNKQKQKKKTDILLNLLIEVKAKAAAAVVVQKVAAVLAIETKRKINTKKRIKI